MRRSGTKTKNILKHTKLKRYGICRAVDAVKTIYSAVLLVCNEPLIFGASSADNDDVSDLLFFLLPDDFFLVFAGGGTSGGVDGDRGGDGARPLTFLRPDGDGVTCF